jgi:hypothetical protein
MKWSAFVNMLAYIGTALSVFTVIFSSYFLLVKDVEVTRIVTFAVIGLFSGIIMLLRDRITSIRLPILGEVVAKAREDATEITKIRDDVQTQSNSIKVVLKQAADLKNEMGELTKELEFEKLSVRKQFIKERISALNADIKELQRVMHLNLSKPVREGIPSTNESNRAIFRLQAQVSQYAKDLEKLELDESDFDSEKID